MTDPWRSEGCLLSEASRRSHLTLLSLAFAWWSPTTWCWPMAVAQPFDPTVTVWS